MAKKTPVTKETANVKINIKYVLSGDLAEIFLELKRRGIIKSARDAFTQGFICLHDRVLRRDLKVAQLKASRRLSEEF